MKGRGSIRQRLLLLVAALAVPMNVLVVVALVQLADQERTTHLRNLQYTARAIVSAIDAQLLTHITVGRALAASPALLDDDLAAFRAEAERVNPVLMVVSDIDGQQLMNTRRPPGEKLPMRVGLVTHRQALETGLMAISDVFRGSVSNAWLVTLDFPVFREGKAFRVMSVIIDTATFRALLEGQRQPPNWLAGIADKRGNFIARIPEHDANVGQPASADWREVMDHNGVERVRAIDGSEVWNANEISLLSGWRVGIAVKESEVAAPIWTTIGGAVLASIIVSLLSLLLALRLAHGIAGPVRELERKAAALVAGQEGVLEPRLPEVARVWEVLQSAMAKRGVAERQSRLLVDELAHRVKNTLAVVQAIAMQSLRLEPDPRAFVEKFSGRLALLSRAHDLLTGHAWTSAALDEIITAALAPFRRPTGEDMFALAGPPVQVSATPAITLSLMLHELATNAAKYGALSGLQGRVDVTWTLSNTPDPVVHLIWCETGGPPVQPPANKGYGSRLLSFGAAQLGGQLDFKWSTDGMVCRLTFPCPTGSVAQERPHAATT